MRAAIFLTGHASDYTREKYGDYDRMFKTLLDRDGVDWTVFQVKRGEFPANAADFDAYVITGSPANAHDDLVWIQDLNAALRDIYAAGKRILGVCFGHQAVANALGGRSERSPNGWEAGTHAVQFTPAYFNQAYAVDTGAAINILEIHRDHVVELPPGAELLASNDHSQVQMYRVGDHVLCMQGHPEFFNDVVEELVVSRAETGLMEKDEAAAMLATLSREPHRQALQTLCQNFLYGKAR